MKAKTLLLLAGAGLTAAGLYAYKHREAIQDEINDVARTIKSMQSELDPIQKNLATIQQQLGHAQNMAEDLGYKARVFSGETQARLESIKTIVDKYQEDNH